MSENFPRRTGPTLLLVVLLSGDGFRTTKSACLTCSTGRRKINLGFLAVTNVAIVARALTVNADNLYHYICE
jgi:hypothetical protein